MDQKLKWKETENDTRFNLQQVRLLLSPLFSAFDTDELFLNAVSVFNKLIVTTLKYTPMVFSAQVPYKEVSGK